MQSKDCTAQAFEGEKALKSFFILQLHLLVDLSSCYTFEWEEPTPNPWDNPRYYQFSTEELEWLDLEGYWVYRESEGRNTDTIFFRSSGIDLKRASVRWDINSETYTEFFFDEAYLSFRNTNWFNDDSTMTIRMRSHVGVKGWPRGIFYGDEKEFICLHPALCYETLFKVDPLNPPKLISIDGFSNVIRSVANTELVGRTFYLAKGIGIVRVYYDNNDSINTLTLIDYSLK